MHLSYKLESRSDTSVTVSINLSRVSSETTFITAGSFKVLSKVSNQGNTLCNMYSVSIFCPAFSSKSIDFSLIYKFFAVRSPPPIKWDIMVYDSGF